ncbi:tetratricopeptide repeat protein [Falsiroseomonas tokyonensis]|uniref:Tetratricopeptide repeat protein n=1 Tax=Falsiroseomonas tokyonensis TaxID=430521 RepID=A0ABV7C006_9PROT|nr:tetratricopeptide repeat protein [Falsiroseomonas tokyonensis]MBU8541007.1 tetratricopeptide repeat protein [Falsiroseomonas tokyonensis]
MTWFVPPRRALLLAAALLSGCAAAGTPSPATTPVSAEAAEPSGVFGNYLSGRFAQSETDTRAAADRLLEALRRDPDQPEVLSRAFAAALLDGRPEALRLARRLPQNQAAALLLVGSDSLAGRWDRAEQRVRALPRQGPSQLLQPLLLAWVQQGRGQTDAALATLRPLAEAGRLRGIHALHMALIADLAGRTREAERAIRIAMAETPDPSLRLLQVATAILSRAGREAEAMALVDGLARGLGDYAVAAATPASRRALLETRPVGSAVDGIAESYLALAAALRQQGGGEATLILSRLSLRLRPNFAPTLLLIAENYAEDRHPETALQVLEGLPAGDPLASVATLRRAGLYDRMDRVEMAETLLRGLAADMPSAPQPLLRLGDMLRARNRFPDAVTAYDGALARIATPGGGDWPLFYARGISNERSGNWPRAEADFQRALELAPEQPYVLNYLAYTWVERRERLPEARRMLERAVELRPNDGNIVDSLGWALFHMGDIPGALAALERAVELEPRNSVINDHLGDVYWAAGRQQEARFQWRRALGLEPEPDDLAKITTKLRDGLPDPPASTAQRRD